MYCHCEHIHGACAEETEVLSVNSVKQSDTKCHSECSEESQWDCFVASLLAMTAVTVYFEDYTLQHAVGLLIRV